MTLNVCVATSANVGELPEADILLEDADLGLSSKSSVYK